MFINLEDSLVSFEKGGLSYKKPGAEHHTICRMNYQNKIKKVQRTVKLFK